jgi:hypothetical protein
METPHIPALRRGKPYESMDRTVLKDLRNDCPVGEISQVNAGIIRRDMRTQNRDCLRAFTTDQLLAMSEEAGKLFMEGILPIGSGTQSPEDYIRQISATTGLPHSLVRRNMAKVHSVFANMRTIVRGLTMGLETEILDSGMGVHDGMPVSFICHTDSLGVVLPSNSPGVNSLWMPSIALKVPVVLKPGREEPWTPYRIIQAFVAAGVPAEAFSFYPTDHEGSGAVMDVCGRALIFGDVGTVQKYAGNPGVQVHGPGWSKVIIGEDMVDRWQEFVDIIATSIVENGGRSCVNASAVVTPRHAEAIADAVAQRLAAFVPRRMDDPDAILAGFANPKMAEWIESTVVEGLQTPGATEVTAKYRSGDRLVQLDGGSYLQPTLVHCSSWEHPLANREFLFPYACVVQTPQSEVLGKIGSSLVVSAITEDPAFIDQLVQCRHIDRLNIGPLPTTKVQWDQPHEGNMFEFMFKRRAIQRA